jgi:hypothetical protein
MPNRHRSRSSPISASAERSSQTLPYRRCRSSHEKTIRGSEAYRAGSHLRLRRMIHVGTRSIRSVGVWVPLVPLDTLSALSASFCRASPRRPAVPMDRPHPVLGSFPPPTHAPNYRLHLALVTRRWKNLGSNCNGACLRIRVRSGQCFRWNRGINLASPGLTDSYTLSLAGAMRA